MGLTSYAQTGINAYPFKPEEDRRFRRLEQKVVAKYFWDFSVQGGASTGALTMKPYYSAAQLPANSIIVRSYFITNTAVTSNGGNIGKAAFACGSASILAATTVQGNFASQYAVFDGLQTGASTAFSNVVTQCSPTITWSIQSATAGRIDLWIEYVKPADINAQ